AVMRLEQAAMAPMIAATAPARALDVGTGTGRYLPALVRTGAQVVVGLDFSLAMLTREAAPRGLRVCGDAHRLPFADAAFDLVSAALMLGDVADLPAWMAEMSRVLRPGGHLIYSDFHPTWRIRGWRRTFRDRDGQLIELPCCAHSIAEHAACLQA